MSTEHGEWPRTFLDTLPIIFLIPLKPLHPMAMHLSLENTLILDREAFLCNYLSMGNNEAGDVYATL
jgi:hypothetical protein